MITLTGTFKDRYDNDIIVTIEKESTDTSTFTFNEEGCGLYFAGDEPVSIIQDVENEFQHILPKQCTINLICEDYVGNLFFADNARDVSVKVVKWVDTGMSMQGTTLFKGFLEPIAFAQGFAHKIESFTLTANDYLGTLEYLKYKDITLTTYVEAKQNASNVSFEDMLFDILPDEQNTQIWYDQSKGLDSSRITSVWSDLGLFESYLLGETYDDLWTKQEVLDEMLRYLNLHIIQEGEEFFIFDWDFIRGEGGSTWYNLKNGRQRSRSLNFVTLEKEHYAGSDTNVTVAEVYNQIMVTDELESIETVIESPLDSNSLKSFYPSKFKYMTEYIAPGEGSTAKESFMNMIHRQPTDYSGAQQINWSAQPMYNVNWKLNTSTGDINDLVEFDSNGVAINPYKLPLYVNQNPLTPLIMKCGSFEKKQPTDDSPDPPIDMSPYLFISLRGNDVDSNTDDFPGNTELEALHNRGPMMEYTSKQSGGTFSPVDDGTNYLVFTGKMLLLPRTWESGRYLNCQVDHAGDPTFQPFTGRSYDGDGGFWRVGPVRSDKMSSDSDHENRRWYTRQFYKPTYTQEQDPSTLSWIDEIGLDYLDPEIPFSGNMFEYSKAYDSLQMWPEDKGAKELHYKFSSNNNTNDRIKKLPILQCELIIGNKRLVEHDMDENGNSKFSWVDVDSGVPQNVGTEFEYLEQYFTLGIDPKTQDGGDFILGTEFDLQNTINGITGTAIEIKKTDALSGAITFRILGPINLTYDEVTRRNGNFWYWHTRWSTNTKSVLSHCESIIIKDFECKLEIAGADDIEGDNDLIYVSDETDRYISKNDDTTFRFVTQLSNEECFEKGISPSVNQNTVVDMTSNLPVRAIYNALTDETAKPEEHYVNQYYNIFSVPRITTETTLKEGLVYFEYLYEMTGIDGTNYVLGVSKNVKMNTATVKLKNNAINNL